MTKLYIGCKLIQAEEMSEESYRLFRRGINEKGDYVRPGYKVTYPGGYVSWSPKDVFENAYREVTKEEIKVMVEPITNVSDSN